MNDDVVIMNKNIGLFVAVDAVDAAAKVTQATKARKERE
jgi:hypothetical protein